MAKSNSVPLPIRVFLSLILAVLSDLAAAPAIAQVAQPDISLLVSVQGIVTTIPFNAPTRTITLPPGVTALVMGHAAWMQPCTLFLPGQSVGFAGGTGAETPYYPVTAGSVSITCTMLSYHDPAADLVATPVPTPSQTPTPTVTAAAAPRATATVSPPPPLPAPVTARVISAPVQPPSLPTAIPASVRPAAVVPTRAIPSPSASTTPVPSPSLASPLVDPIAPSQAPQAPATRAMRAVGVQRPGGGVSPLWLVAILLLPTGLLVAAKRRRPPETAGPSPGPGKE